MKEIKTEIALIAILHPGDHNYQEKLEQLKEALGPDDIYDMNRPIAWMKVRTPAGFQKDLVMQAGDLWSYKVQAEKIGLKEA